MDIFYESTASMLMQQIELYTILSKTILNIVPVHDKILLIRDVDVTFVIHNVIVVP